MAYDPTAAHEYYIKYRKKGLKKGRKKGKAKSTKAKTTSLVGVSSSGLNDAGRIEAAIIKDRIKKEMNDALSKATSDTEKERIRAEYSKKAQDEITKLKSDSKYASPKSSKSSGSGKSSSKVSSDKSSKSKASSNGSKATAEVSTPKTNTNAPLEIDSKTITSLKNQIYSLREMLPDMTPEQKQRVANTIKTILKTLKEAKGLSEKEEKRYSEGL